MKASRIALLALGSLTVQAAVAADFVLSSPDVGADKPLAL